MLHNELPTLDRLAIRNFKLYDNFKQCCLCHNAIETREHLFVCKELNDQTNEAWQISRDKALKKLCKTYDKDKDNKEDSNQDLIKRSARIGNMFDNFERETYGSCNKLMLFTLGLVNKKNINALGKSIGNKRGARKRAEQTMVYFSKKFRENFRRIAWNYRCEIINEADKTRGITKKVKKQKADRSTVIHTLKKTRIKRPNLSEKTTLYINSSIEKVKNIIHNKIETGAKWLGI